MDVPTKANQALDALIEHWSFWDKYESYYLERLAPDLVRDPSRGDGSERDILGRLRSLLSNDEWHELPRLIALRREERRLRAVIDELKSLIAAHKWHAFDDKLVEANLPEKILQELVILKNKEVTAGQKELEEKRLHDELKSLIADHNWPAFDAKLAGARLLDLEREELLEQKAIALSTCIPDEVRPDTAQARILASPAKTIQVTARAGSGKTRLLSALTYYLIDGYGISPDEILVLAFNRDAAGQLEDRLTKLLKIPAFPGARTFHSLAYGIAQPEQEVLFDQGEEVATRGLSLLVQDIFRSLLDEELLEDVYDFFRSETAEARSTGAFLNGADAYDFRRSLTQYTLGGQAVKSRGEKFIGDFLFEHGLIHYYENPTPWEGGWYRPDFKIMTGKKTFLIWEHWAVDPDAEVVIESSEWPKKKIRDYQEAARRKREFWRRKDIPLLASCAQDCGNREAFEIAIATKLQPYFPELKRLSSEELIKKMQDVHLSRFATWIGQAIQRAEKRGLDAKGLSEAFARYTPETKREQVFLALVEQVFASYEPRLGREGKTDFDRLFNRAIALLSAEHPQTILDGKQVSIDLRRLRYCLVDEAQDLSPQFVEAVTCLRKLNPSLRLIFVGDDWQAINRFAGSDVELFTQKIATRFGKCATATLATNYRSVRKVVLAGNQLMRGQGAEAQAHTEVTGAIQLAYTDQVWVEGREENAGWQADAPFRQCGRGAETFFKALYQLAVPDLAAGKTVGVLFRTNTHMGKKLPELEKLFVNLVRQMGWPREDVEKWRKGRIRFSTVHRFKGAERQTVFVVNPSANSFPLLNADSIGLFRFFGDSLDQAEADERRLFYVAITRAQERLVFLTEARREEDSPYLETFRDLIEKISVPVAPIQPPENKSPTKVSGEEEFTCETKGDDKVTSN